METNCSEESAASLLPELVQLHPPLEFDFDNSSGCPTWCLQYEDYVFAFGLCAAAPELQVRPLFYCMGTQARVVFAPTPLEEIKKTHRDIVAVKKELSDHFVHPLNELYRYTVPLAVTAVYSIRETCDAFFTALRTLVKDCKYLSASVDERFDHDRFVIGLLYRKLSDHLCRNP